MKPRTRDGKSGIREINWQQLYAKTEVWQSDLRFFEYEIRFFRDLMAQHIMQLIEDLEKTRSITETLFQLEKLRQSLMKMVSRHRRHLSDQFSSPFVMAGPDYHEEYGMIADKMAEFKKKYRSAKSVVFRYMEHILREKKEHHLIYKR